MARRRESGGLTRRSALAAAAGAALLPLVASCGTGFGGRRWRAMTWEGAEECRKWLRHLNLYFEENPGTDWALDYGLSWDQYWAKLQTAVAGGAPLDLCWMHDTRNALFSSIEMLSPLDDYLRDDPPPGWPDGYYASQVSSFSYEGKQFAFPYDFATAGFYVNVDWFERAGVDLPTEDWTFDQLLDAGLELKNAADDPERSWGFLLPTGNNCHWVIKSFGGEFVTPDPLSAHFTEPETVEGFQYLYDAIFDTEVMPSPQQVLAASGGNGDLGLFAQQKVAMIVTLNDAAFVMDEFVGDKFRWTVAPTPRGRTGRYQYSGGSGLAIPSAATLPDLSYEVIKFMLSVPANLRLTAKMGSMFVSRMDLWRDGLPPADVLDLDDSKRVFYDLGLRDATHPYYFPSFGRWDNAVYTRYTDNLWVGNERDVTKVLAQVQEDTEELLNEPI
jgi:multiple sugar transport system substrate-binding protein